MDGNNNGPPPHPLPPQPIPVPAGAANPPPGPGGASNPHHVTPHNPFVTPPKITLPTLMPDQVDIWLYQVRAFMNTNNLKDALLPTAPAVPLDGTTTQQTTPIEAQVTAAKSAILAALPEDTVKNIGSGIVYLNPAAILEKVLEAHQKKSTPEYRELLRQKASNLTIKYKESIAEYVTRHEELRNEMERAKVEEISDEYTTVRYIIRGLRTSSVYQAEVPGLLTQCALTPALQKIAKCKDILEMYEQEKTESRTAWRNKRQGGGTQNERQTAASDKGPNWCAHHEDWVYHLEKNCRLGKQRGSGSTTQKNKEQGTRNTKGKGKANKAVVPESDSSDGEDGNDSVNDLDCYMLDSGCHPTYTRAKPPGQAAQNATVRLPDGSTRATKRHKRLLLTLQNGAEFMLNHVDHAQDFKDNLLSISAITRNNNCHVVLTPTGGMFIEPQQYNPTAVKGTIVMRNDLYYVDNARLSKPAPTKWKRIRDGKRHTTKYHDSKQCTAQGASVLGTPDPAAPDALPDVGTSSQLQAVTPAADEAVTQAAPITVPAVPSTALPQAEPAAAQDAPETDAARGQEQHVPAVPIVLHHTPGTDGNAEHTPRARGSKSRKVTAAVPYPKHVSDISPADRERYDEAHTWHVILNHVNNDDLQLMAQDKRLGLPRNLRRKLHMDCSGCSEGKMQRAPHTGVTPRPPPGHTLVTDLAEVELSELGYLHVMTVTEMHTRFKWGFLLKRKSEAERYLIETVAKVQHHFDKPVVKIRCDNANEYLTKSELRILGRQGTTVIPIIPHTPQLNSVAERTNRTLMGKVRATLSTMSLPFKVYWPHCVLDTIIKQNSSYQRTVQDVPRKLFEKCRSAYSPFPRRSLNLQQFRAFGELGYIPDLRDKLRKRDPRALLVRYLFCAHPGRYKVMVPETGQLLLCRIQDFRPYNPNFDPRRLFNPDSAIRPERRKPRVNSHHVHVAEAHAAHQSVEHPQQKTEELPMIDCTRTPAETACAAAEQATDPLGDDSKLRVQVPPPPAPTTLRQARNAADAEMWQAAYEKEMQSHMDFGTFKLVPRKSLKQGTQAPRSVVTFTYKTEQPTGAIIGRKARISYPGNQLKQTQHYDPAVISTYTADRDAIRFVLAFAVTFRTPNTGCTMQLRHLDLRTAFLHEPYDGLIPLYMSPSLNFDGTQPFPHHVVQIMQNIYGTRHAPKVYIEGMYNHLSHKQYQQLRSDINVYVRNEGEHKLLMAVTVDDFLVAYTCENMYKELLTHLSSKYTLKDLGFPRKLLKWNITRDRPGTGLLISQPELVSNLIVALNLQNANTTKTPFLSGVPLHPALPDEERIPKQYPYAQAIGMLRYIVDCTRPDLAYGAGMLARALASPTLRHWKTLKQMVKYLKGTLNHGLHYRPSGLELSAQSDADFSGCKKSLKSTYGNVILLGNNPISWRSQRIGTVVLTTCAAEYIGMSNTAQHLHWLREFMFEITGTHASASSLLQGDNQSAQKTANNSGPTKRSKYISLRYHYLRDKVRQGVIRIQHVPSRELTADIFTKPLTRVLFEQHAAKLITDCSLPSLQGAVEDRRS